MVPYQGSKQPVGVHRWQKKKTPDSNPSCRTSGFELIKCVGRCDSSVCFVCSHVPLYVWDKYSGSIGQNEPTTQIRVPARCQIKIRDGLDSTCASSILL